MEIRPGAVGDAPKRDTETLTKVTDLGVEGLVYRQIRKLVSVMLYNGSVTGLHSN